MISAIDICGFCGLDPEQIDASAEHEHIPEVAAAALASEYCNRLACEIEVLCVCAGYVCMHCMMKPMFVIG